MIIHTEKNFIICKKHPGISSQKASDGKKDMIDLISEELGLKADSVYPIHRLDNPVGGTMVYAVTKEGASKLSKAVSENKIQKRYLAVLCSVPEEKEGVLKDLLFKDSSKNKTYVVKRMRKGVKEASLEYKILSVAEYMGKTYALAEILLHTGRTHQIRIQFASRKMPLAGDRRYGSGKDDLPLGLWSYSLDFDNPFNQNQSEHYETLPDKEKLPWSIFKEI